MIRSKLESLLGTANVRLLDRGERASARPWDIKLHDSAAIRKIALKGTLGFGEAYMDHMWDSDHLDDTMFRLMRSGVFTGGMRGIVDLVDSVRNQALNLQSRARAFIVAEEHYDLGNELFIRMLDKNMVYTCALWEDGAPDLDTAQVAKMDLLCQKLHLESGMDLLDIGCGWGGLARHAAENYGVRVVGLTISKEQAKYARDLCKGLPVEIHLQDYRENREKFDRAVSVEMIEAVGIKNLRTYFKVIHDSLRDDPNGKDLFAMQVIGRTYRFSPTEPWMVRYIFPNGMLPSKQDIHKATDGLFILEHWQNLTPNYVHTLEAWWQNFDKHWPELKQLGGEYDEQFYRKWKYYLRTCKAAFKARIIDDSQYVFSKKGVLGGYQPSAT